MPEVHNENPDVYKQKHGTSQDEGIPCFSHLNICSFIKICGTAYFIPVIEYSNTGSKHKNQSGEEEPDHENDNPSQCSVCGCIIAKVAYVNGEREGNNLPEETSQKRSGQNMLKWDFFIRCKAVQGKNKRGQYNDTDCPAQHLQENPHSGGNTCNRTD